jgi:glycosyltransferase involved in cell wall biosynthesis
MKIAALVPHIEVCGGVRRYFEMGNALMNYGHKYDLFYKDLLTCKTPWMKFNGNLLSYGHLQFGDYDLVFTGAAECLDDLAKVKATVRCVLVVARFYTECYEAIWKRYKDDYLWVGCGSKWKEQFCGDNIPKGYDCPGGVNVNYFVPDEKRRSSKECMLVLFYRRDEGYIRGLPIALEGIKKFTPRRLNWEFVGYDVKPVPDSWKGLEAYGIYGVQLTTQEGLLRLLQSGDIILSAQVDGIWNNILAEGMACGMAGLGTPTASSDFLTNYETGRIIMPGDSDSIADCLSWFDSNIEVLSSYQVQALNCIRSLFSWGNFADRFIKIVKEFGNAKRGVCLL